MCVLFGSDVGLSLCVHELLHQSTLTIGSLLPVFGVINKDYKEAVCLYSSQCVCLSGDTVLQS